MRESDARATLLARLERGEVLVLDGSMGATLCAQGWPPDVAQEVWALAHRDVLHAVHRSYIEAGADVLLTATLNGNRVALGRHGLAGEARSLNRRLAEELGEVIRQSGRRVVLAGNLGPTGALLAPVGTLTEAEAVDAYAEQVAGLLEGGAEAIIIETMTDPAEARAALRAAREAAAAQGRSGVPLIATMAFDVTPRGYRTVMGATPPQAVEVLLEAGADVVGANCGSVLAAEMPGLVREMRAAGARYVAVEPNAGLPQVVDGQTVFPQRPEEMAAAVPAILEAGTSLIGGCCGTTPEHVRQIAALVRARGARRPPA